MSDLYEMTVDLNVLDHLGINLYSNIAAVITESVANAWDADAELIEINIDKENDLITIKDNGIGMSISDMNQKYLRVGYRRRVEDTITGEVTAKGRPVMGRKGLGKLSLFSIANCIEVQSIKDGEASAHGLKMSIADIKDSVRLRERSYKPVSLEVDALSVTKGTQITLGEIKRTRLGKSVQALRRRLARRFSVIGEKFNFKILINGQPVTMEDRGDLSALQFLWKIEGSEVDTSAATKVKETGILENSLPGWESNIKVSGWIGTSRTPKELDSEELGNLNGIVVLSRGRLFHENILDRLNDGRLFTKYLTGQIEADFLDANDKPDIATSDRQRVQEDDERYIALIAFLKSALNKVESKWSDWRKKHEVEKAKEESPALKQWLDGLPSGFRKSAESLIAQISSIPVDNDVDQKLMFKHGVIAFERMKLRGSTDEFGHSLTNPQQLLELLGDRDALEASLYRDIVNSRLDAIKQFNNLLDQDAKEKVLQEYLFNHLWLLDPSWERASGSEAIESKLIAEGVIIDDLTKKEELGRVDIAYKTSAGKHLIIELKRAGASVTLHGLNEQGTKYFDKLKKICRSLGDKNPNIEVIFVLGKEIPEESSNPERIKHSMNAISPGSRIMYYDGLIHSAQNSYASYLEKSKELDKLELLVDNI
ncbi:ATP-binding protein [Aliidiomarina shirensis]|uniref:ATP-binding protein n=1 Tax=Aliidiomarina shirensis TaxID=1048642 RepID=A0A432WWM0_9GAMM|nr:ATP-binding protein [Aliidiomarina shirensis]RUO38137.1 ATP-binding protein [Aliidiomarina shirensis]